MLVGENTRVGRRAARRRVTEQRELALGDEYFDIGRVFGDVVADLQEIGNVLGSLTVHEDEVALGGLLLAKRSRVRKLRFDRRRARCALCAEQTQRFKLTYGRTIPQETLAPYEAIALDHTRTPPHPAAKC